jgi:predicted transcriptional regulator
MHPLTHFCQVHNLSLCRFADQAGIPNSTVYRLVNGRRRPRPELIRRIIAATGGKVTAEALSLAHFLPIRSDICHTGRNDSVEQVVA